MTRFFLGCLALCALALMVGQATAVSNNGANNAADNGGVLIVETYTASAQPVSDSNSDMQPLPNNPGVEVAPDNSSADATGEPVMVEEDMTIQQTEQGE